MGDKCAEAADLGSSDEEEEDEDPLTASLRVSDNKHKEQVGVAFFSILHNFIMYYSTFFILTEYAPYIALEINIYQNDSSSTICFDLQDFMKRTYCSKSSRLNLTAFSKPAENYNMYSSAKCYALLVQNQLKFPELWFVLFTDASSFDRPSSARSVISHDKSPKGGKLFSQ